MTVEVIIGQCVNYRKDEHIGFDSFSQNLDRTRFALCDGANSCLESGQTSQWLSSKIVNGNILTKENADDLVGSLHSGILKLYPNTASTLVYLQIESNRLISVSVGDSYLSVYRQPFLKFVNWKQTLEMPRDLNADGNPFQLIGSEVLDCVHYSQVEKTGVHVALMMSDGPANAISDREIQKMLRLIGRNKPTQADLTYISKRLVQLAWRGGCKDDASVVTIWINIKK
tara:strand:+ start:8408 stop:9091 length:684 start_codon:yes stop_codon:yes gene_type:complete